MVRPFETKTAARPEKSSDRTELDVLSMTDRTRRPEEGPVQHHHQETASPTEHYDRATSPTLNFEHFADKNDKFSFSDVNRYFSKDARIHALSLHLSRDTILPYVVGACLTDA
jgi:hypothetical protein